MPKACPHCGFDTTRIEGIEVEVIAPPPWWPDGVVYPKQGLGTVDRIWCSRCNWEREVWS